MSAVFHLSPLVGESLLYGAAVMAAVGFGLSFASARAWRWRALAFALLLAAVLNPVSVHEKSEPLDDIVLVVVDRSVSQTFGERMGRTEAVLAHLKEKLGRVERLKVEVIDVQSTRHADEGDGTYLFDAARQALSRYPKEQSAGVILLTDGQVHDAGLLDGAGPVQAILTGSKTEKDRSVVVEGMPSYGVVGRPVEFYVKVRQSGFGNGGVLALHVAHDGREIDVKAVPAGEGVTLSYPLSHGGENFFEFSVEAADGELTQINNRAVVSVNGVRDRLKVLLISGKPYPGERIWRNLLKSDASVDLVHFTILRSPERIDPTPNSELSLIAFPVEELFSEKINDFDLIIFDRYEFKDVLSPVYLRNIVNFVKGGGGLLMAGGPDYVSKNALYQTELRDVLPAKPLGDQVIEQAFQPQLTEKGRRHPVASALISDKDDPHAKPRWGRWFRQARVDPGEGTVLMSGVDDLPLLILSHAGDGRVAQLTSDNIWLWAKGIEGGGPHNEILRRLVHWLMKEPELEENALKARISNGNLMVEQRSLENVAPAVSVETPSGENRSLAMTDNGRNGLSGTLEAHDNGVYKVSDGLSTVFAASGDLSSPELSDITSTDALLAPVVVASAGRVLWYDEHPDLGVRMLDGSRDTFGGGDWIGLRRNHAMNTLEVSQRPLAPPLIWLAILLGALLGVWLREGRKSRTSL